MPSTASGTTPCCPSPAPPPRQNPRPPPPAARTSTAWQTPLAAAREQRLSPTRGGPRRIDNHRVPRTRLTPQARLLAAVFRYRLGMTGRAVAALFGIDTSVISIATRQI